MAIEPPRGIQRFWRSPFGERLIRLLEPSRWWIVIFIVGIIFVNVWTLTIYRTQAKDEAAHAAENVANSDGQYVACLKSIPVLEKVNGIIENDRIIRDALVKNSRANHLADPGDPVKAENYRRLKQARADAYQVKFPIPTKESCAELRSRLLRAR